MPQMPIPHPPTLPPREEPGEPPDPRYCSTHKASRILGNSTDTVRLWLNTGKLRGHKRGGRWWVSLIHITQLIADWKEEEESA